MRKSIVTIIGTRPEAIKMSPVHLELSADPRFSASLVATGQHGALLDDALAVFGLAPDHRLEQDHRHLARSGSSVPAIEHALTPLLARLAPDLVLVQGDTNSALAAALAAHALGLSIGHVEAGLRSHDTARPWPEEGNRIAIDRLSTLLFAPTETAMSNLATDRQVNGHAALTGNSSIDALLRLHRPARQRPPRDPLGPRRLLVTLHRREAIGPPLKAMCRALRTLAARGDVRISLPLHPNPDVCGIVWAELATHPAVELIQPLPYPDMIARMAMADLVLSDSGGLQEEAPALGVPLLILRDTTERPEAVTCGAARLAGTDPRAIVSHASEILDDDRVWRAMAQPRFPFGQGDAAKKIISVIENYLGDEKVT